MRINVTHQTISLIAYFNFHVLKIEDPISVTVIVIVSTTATTVALDRPELGRESAKEEVDRVTERRDAVERGNRKKRKDVTEAIAVTVKRIRKESGPDPVIVIVNVTVRKGSETRKIETVRSVSQSSRKAILKLKRSQLTVRINI